MKTSELVEYLALGEKNAEELLKDINPNLKSRFQRACHNLAKIVNEVREVYPDANIYLTNDVPNLLLGDSHSESEKDWHIDDRIAKFEMIACDSDKLKGKIDGGDW